MTHTSMTGISKEGRDQWLDDYRDLRTAQDEMLMSKF